MADAQNPPPPALIEKVARFLALKVKGHRDADAPLWINDTQSEMPVWAFYEKPAREVIALAQPTPPSPPQDHAVVGEGGEAAAWRVTWDCDGELIPNLINTKAGARQHFDMLASKGFSVTMEPLYTQGTTPVRSDRVAELEAAWQPIETAPKDGTRINLKQGNMIAEGCSWGLCDVGYSQHGRMRWAWAPTDLEPTHWRPYKPPSLAGGA